MRKIADAVVRAVYEDGAILARFWAHVARDDSDAGCWEWQGRVKPRGYPMVFIGRHSIAASRVAWFTVTGELPMGGKLHHVCDNPCCVRPSHLAWAVGRRTQRVLDSLSDGYVRRAGVDAPFAARLPHMPRVLRFVSEPDEPLLPKLAS